MGDLKASLRESEGCIRVILFPLSLHNGGECFGKNCGKATSFSLIKGFSVGWEKLNISHLQFSNNTLLFVEGEERRRVSITLFKFLGYFLALQD